MPVLASSRGIVAALITPFTPSNTVDLDSLRLLIEHAIRLGVRGLYVCGTTGEGFLLSEDERRQVVEVALDAAARRVDVIVNVSHMDLRQAVRLSEHATMSKADAISSLPPLFYQAGAKEQLAYFRALLDSSPLPLSVYNIPHLSHQQLHASTIAALAEVKHFIGIKHTSADAAAIAQFKEVADGRLIVWCGRDAGLLEHLAMGADGAIGSSYQLWGDIAASLLDFHRAGDLSRATSLQQRFNVMHARLQIHGPIQSIKRCLTLAGIPCGDCRLPLAPARKDVDAFLLETMDMADRIRTDFAISS